MTNSITRNQAKTWTLVAQLASVVFVLCGVALGIIGLPEPKVSSSLDTTNQSTSPDPFASTTNATNTPNSSSKSGSSQTSSIDTLGLSQRLALLDNAPILIKEDPVDDSPVEVVDDGNADDGQMIKRVRYIGFINDPAARHAFIRIDGKQRIVAEGKVARSGNADFPDLTVERVTPNAILLSDGNKRARVELATKNGQSITMAGGAPVEVVSPATNGSLLTAEDEARIAAMPPRQQPSARRRLERERRGLPPDPPRGRPEPKPLREYRGGFTTRND